MASKRGHHLFLYMNLRNTQHGSAGLLSHMSDRCVLLVDGFNLYIRSYSAFPQMSSHGYQMGGAIGFLKTLSRITAELKPKAVYIAWEGGGSQRRRKLFKEYKMSRKPQRMNRFYGDDIPDSEENKKHQLLSLLEMTKNIPVCQLYVADCEGDDVIAYLSTAAFKDDKKVIVSSDKDMYQLLDDNTMQYSLHKKRCVTAKDVHEEFRVTTHNFAVAKALCGDAGDNIPGVKGLGFKKLIKFFPMLGLDEVISIRDVLDYSASHVDENKMYKRVLEFEKDLIRNYKLVYLNDSMISANQVTKLNYAIETFEPKINKMGLMKVLIKEGITDFDLSSFFLSFHGVEGLSYGGKG